MRKRTDVRTLYPKIYMVRDPRPVPPLELGNPEFARELEYCSDAGRGRRRAG